MMIRSPMCMICLFIGRLSEVIRFSIIYSILMIFGVIYIMTLIPFLSMSKINDRGVNYTCGLVVAQP